MSLAIALACHSIDADRIVARDLAAANPAFSSIAPEAIVGASPIPGVRRLFHADELVRLARAHNIALSAPVSEICIQRATEPLTLAQVTAALQNIFDKATTEVLDFSRIDIPPGKIEFPRSGLSPSGFWRGHVTYSENRTIAIWAKVRITTEQTWIEAASSIDSGAQIAAAQLVIRTGPRSPLGPAPLDSIDAAAGRKSLRAIKPGEPIFAAMLTSPRDVERGEKVAVDVSVGAANISFEAIAESSGRAGETVLIRNPQNERFFQARVESKGKVVVNK